MWYCVMSKVGDRPNFMIVRVGVQNYQINPTHSNYPIGIWLERPQFDYVPLICLVVIIMLESVVW